MNTGRVYAAQGNGSPQEIESITFTLAERLYGGTGPYSTVGMTVGRTFGYGDLKVIAHVSVQCTQNEELLEEAGKRAFLKAAELLDDGIAIMCKKLESEQQR